MDFREIHIYGYSSIECKGNESALEECDIGELAFKICSSIGVVLSLTSMSAIITTIIIVMCIIIDINFVFLGPLIYIKELTTSAAAFLVATEGQSVEFCIVLSGSLMENMNVHIKTIETGLALGNKEHKIIM